jgi:protein-tyrosine-phosphatase
MTETFFNNLAGGKAQALSVGTQPADEVNPVVIEAMKEVGMGISGKKPKILTIDMVEKAERMITMGCGAEAETVCTASFIETEDWSLENPEDKSLGQVRKIRDEIKGRIVKLLDEF